MVYQITNSLDSYTYWMKYGSVLERIVDAGDGIFSSGQLPEIMAGTKILQEVKDNYLPHLSPEHKRIVRKAEIVIGDVLKKIKTEKGTLSSLESIIHGDVVHWSENSERSEEYAQLQSLLQKCETYSHTKELYLELSPSERVSSLGSFYQDVGNLTELLSDISYDKVVIKYASSNTKEELQQAQQDFGKSVWQKIEAEKERLLQKYQGKLSKAETEFIKALPGKRWRELGEEISGAVAYAGDYLNKKKDIMSRIVGLQKEHGFLTLRGPELRKEYIEKVVGSTETTNYEANSLLLKEVIIEYHWRVKELVQVKERRKKELVGLVKKEALELTGGINKEIEEQNYGALEGYKTRILEISSYCACLGAKETDVLLQNEFERIERISGYAAAFSGERTKKVLGNEARVIKGETDDKSLLDKRLEAEPKLVAEIETSEINDVPYLPIVKEQDLVVAGFRYGNYSKNEELKGVCREIAGVNEKGEYSCSTLRERRGRMDKSKFDGLGANLAGEDAVIYIALKEGMRKVTKA